MRVAPPAASHLFPDGGAAPPRLPRSRQKTSGGPPPRVTRSRHKTPGGPSPRYRTRAKKSPSGGCGLFDTLRVARSLRNPDYPAGGCFSRGNFPPGPIPPGNPPRPDRRRPPCGRGRSDREGPASINQGFRDIVPRRGRSVPAAAREAAPARPGTAARHPFPRKRRFGTGIA